MTHDVWLMEEEKVTGKLRWNTHNSRTAPRLQQLWECRRDRERWEEWRDVPTVEVDDGHQPAGLQVTVHIMNSSSATVVPQAYSPEAWVRKQLGIWAVQRWRAEVENRPLENKHRRTLDDTWRQVMTYAGLDPYREVGPTHDQLLAAGATSAGMRSTPPTP